MREYATEQPTAMEHCVVDRDGCRIIYGAVPARQLGPLLGEMPEEAVLDQRLAVMLGATFVVGAPEALARLGDAQEAVALERAQADYAHTGLSDEAIRWLAIGEQGLSSRAMFNHITGISPRRYQPDQGGAIPHDSDDFRRCYELYCAVPEIADGLERLRSLSAHWAALVDRWDELAGLFENEEWAALTQQLKEAAGKHNPSGPMAPGM